MGTCVLSMCQSRRAFSALALILAASSTLADATVTDGDTIKLDGTVYRLHGIDAPELRQACPDGWPAGAMAAEALRALVRGRTVACDARSTDRYSRMVAVCRADGADLGAAMVRAGQALAFVRYSADYVREEGEARAAQAALHAHDCLPAWEWRARQRR